MDIGMLWFDDDAKRTLADKVARAAQHYRTKYGAAPTLCFVHPSLLPKENGSAVAGGVQLRSSRTVLLNHFWLGVGDGGAVEPDGNGNGHGRSARKNGKRK